MTTRDSDDKAPKASRKKTKQLDEPTPAKPTTKKGSLPDPQAEKLGDFA